MTNNVKISKKELKRLVHSLLDMVDRRWELGAKNKILGRTYARSKVLASPIYGPIRLDTDVIPFIDSFYVQRLRNISQTGFLHYVFPEPKRLKAI